MTDKTLKTIELGIDRIVNLCDNNVMGFMKATAYGQGFLHAFYELELINESEETRLLTSLCEKLHDVERIQRMLRCKT